MSHHHPFFRYIRGSGVSLWVMGLLVVMALVGCSRPIATKTRKKPSVPKLIDRTRDMSILRTDFKRSATIRFFTIYPAYCRVEYWPSRLGDNPSPTVRKQAPCFQDSPKQSHFVRIENLVVKEPQYIRLMASSSDPLVFKEDDKVILKETTGVYSYFPANEHPELEEQPLKVTVIKANLRQGSAGIFSNIIEAEEFSEERTQFLKTYAGCKPHHRPPYGSLLPPRHIGLSEVSTSGYFSTSGMLLDKERGIFQLDFTGKHEPAINWLFRMKIASDTLNYKVPSPPEFRRFKMLEPVEMAFRKHELTTSPKITTLPVSRGLKLQWTARNARPTDFIEVLIGKPSLGASVRCQYPLKERIKEKTITIAPEDLKGLIGVAKDVVVSLNRKVVSERQGDHVVFLHTHDWLHQRLKFREDMPE